jgi:hypothetical protein
LKASGATLWDIADTMTAEGYAAVRGGRGRVLDERSWAARTVALG